jgi:6-phosphogluconolactonase
MISPFSSGWPRRVAILLVLALMTVALMSAVPNSIVLLYVPNNLSNTMAEFLVDNLTGGLSAFPLQDTTKNRPWEIAVTPNNQFLYVGHEEGYIAVFTVSPNGTTTFQAPPLVNTPNVKGMAIDPAGQFLYTSSGTSNQIFVFSINGTTGVLTPLPAFTVNLAGGTLPQGMAVDALGHLYVAFAGTGTIGQYAIQSNGSLVQIAAPIASGLSTQRLALNPAGTLLFASNSVSGTVTWYGVSPVTGALQAPAGNSITVPVAFPLGLVVQNSGQFLIVVDNAHNTNNVFVYPIGSGGSLSGSGASGIVGSPFTAGSAPAGVAIDPSGRFAFVSNSSSANVSQFSINTVTGSLGTATNFSSGAGSTPLFLISRPAPAGFAPGIPALSSWGLALLGVLLAASSLLMYRKAYR